MHLPPLPGMKKNFKYDKQYVLCSLRIEWEHESGVVTQGVAPSSQWFMKDAIVFGNGSAISTSRKFLRCIFIRFYLFCLACKFFLFLISMQINGFYYHIFIHALILLLSFCYSTSPNLYFLFSSSRSPLSLQMRSSALIPSSPSLRLHFLLSSLPV